MAMMANAMASQYTGWNTRQYLFVRDFILQLMVVFCMAASNGFRLRHRAGGGEAKPQDKDRRPHDPNRKDEADQHTTFVSCFLSNRRLI